jgi:hypothetical protein
MAEAQSIGPAQRFLPGKSKMEIPNQIRKAVLGYAVFDPVRQNTTVCAPDPHPIENAGEEA